MILTDEEVDQVRKSLPAVCTHRDTIRATEAAILQKLSNQEPVAWQFVDDEEVGYIAYQSKPPEQSAVDYLAKWDRPAWQPLYLHPAPQFNQVPDGYALIATDVLKTWGKYDEVKAACIYPVQPPEAK